METERINRITSSPSVVVVSPWTQLIHLFSEIEALWADMQKNPQNAMEDLGKMIALAQQMVGITDKMPIPPSAPNFHKDFQGLLSYLEQMKSSLLSGITHNPDVQKDEHYIEMEMSNIFFDIMQGAS